MRKEKTEYQRAIGLVHAEHRLKKENIDNEKTLNIIKAQEQHGVITRPKFKATYDEIHEMFELILSSNENGNKIINFISDRYKKNEFWVKDVSKTKPKDHIVKALKVIEDNEIIKKSIKNKVFSKSDIIDKSLTGALSSLKKQIDISNRIDDLEAKVRRLKENLAMKENNEDWRQKARELKQMNYSYQKIADELGKKKSTVYDFLKEKSC